MGVSVELTPERLRELAVEYQASIAGMTEAGNHDVGKATARQLVDRWTLAHNAFRNALPPERVLLLAEVWEAAQEHYDAWEGDAGSYDEGQRIVKARERLADVLARLYAANDPGHPQQGEGT